MGAAKEEMIRRDENLHAAAGYLVSVGKLTRCEFHGEVYGGGYDDLDSDFYRVAMGERKKGDHGSLFWADGLETREFTDLLKEAYEEYSGDGCGYCAKYMND